MCATRARFTIAREICHTFFYEYVPEVKFVPHPSDQEEERLCNLGAAELLMPATAVMRSVRTLPVCLKSLDVLAGFFGVSREAMLLRVRSLQLWNVELSSWIWMKNETFAVERILGGKQTNWQWVDESPLRRTWETGKNQAGEGFLEYRDDAGTRQVRPVRYELMRRRNRIVVLWGINVVSSNTQGWSLFRVPRSYLAR